MNKDTTKTFESAMNELQKIVAVLESGTLSLNESLQLYENGVGLIRYCTEELEKAKLVVTQLDVSLEKQNKGSEL